MGKRNSGGGGGGGGHVSPMGAGREREGDGGAAGGERCQWGCPSLTRRLMVLYWTSEEGDKAIV
jgi:hypothetical protein